MGFEPQYENTTVKVCEEKKTDLFAGLAKCCFDCSYQGPSCGDIDDIEADLKRKEMECIDPGTSDFFDVFGIRK